MATADQKNTSSSTVSSAALASSAANKSAAAAPPTIANATPKANTKFLNSTTPQQTHHRKQPPQQPQTARRNSAASSAARRHTTPDMAASAAYGMVLCGSDEMEQRYRGRIEKVKFGVPVNEAFCPDIPATLLVLLLKVNKEGPLKKDIWRAPGNQAQVRKLSHIMQHGRLVNISNISVYTAASVIKRFLAKLPGGIFGVENERQLFEVAEQHSRSVGTHDDQQIIDLFCRIVTALPVPSQHLLVLLFGTFRVITDSAQTFGTRMTPDAIGISVAPSLFHTCIHDGQRAKLEDIMRFKLASQVISKIIQSFGAVPLFPFECYEFYARITGKTLRRDDTHWHISFHVPSIGFASAAAAATLKGGKKSRPPSATSDQLRCIEAYCLAAANLDVKEQQTPPKLRPLVATATLNSGKKSRPPSATSDQLRCIEAYCLAAADLDMKEPTPPKQRPLAVATLNECNRSRPPPATSEQLRRIEAYCLAANLDVKEQTRLINKQRPSTVVTAQTPVTSTAI